MDTRINGKRMFSIKATPEPDTSIISQSNFQVDIPKTKNRILRKVTSGGKKGEDRAAAVLSHELGHIRQSKEITGKTIKDIKKTNYKGRNLVHQINRGGTSGPFSSYPLKAPYEREASQYGVKMLKDKKIPVDKKVINSSLNKSLSKYVQDDKIISDLKNGDRGIKGIKNLYKNLRTKSNEVFI